MKTPWPMILVAALSLGLGACDRAESPTEVREDVAEAQQDAAGEITQEQSEAGSCAGRTVSAGHRAGANDAPAGPVVAVLTPADSSICRQFFARVAGRRQFEWPDDLLSMDGRRAREGAAPL
jgi:hypothetical protein